MNTSRALIVDEAALPGALTAGIIAGYTVDVFEDEPLGADHPFRTIQNVLTTPHVGYGAFELYRTFYNEKFGIISSLLDHRCIA